MKKYSPVYDATIIPGRHGPTMRPTMSEDPDGEYYRVEDVDESYNEACAEIQRLLNAQKNNLSVPYLLERDTGVRMTVGELIKKLEEFDPELPAVVEAHEFVPFDIQRVWIENYEEAGELIAQQVIIEL